MAFTVNFYTFSKREKSTAQPSGAGKAISCTANEPMDLLAPEISLDWRGESGLPTVYNYAYISNFSRYYHVTGWTHRDGLWWASLRVDSLASWKSAIGNQNIYVFRSASGWSGQVEDNLYPTIARRRLLNIECPKVWTIGGANYAGKAANTGMFILGIVTAVGTRHYAMDSANLTNFMSYLMSNAYYEAVLGKFGATEYPEAKVAVNPLQFITSCKWVPIGMASAAGVHTDWAISYGATVTNIGVGGVPVPAIGSSITAYALEGSLYISDPTGDFSLFDIDTDTGDFGHPQADERGDWLNYSPYTNYELYYPPFGLIELDPVEIASNDTLRIRCGLDAKSCKVNLQVQVITGSRTRTILSATADFGVDFPLSNVMTPGSNPAQIITQSLGSILSAAGNFATGNYLGAAGSLIGGATNAIGTVVKGRIPHVSTMGGPGCSVQMYGQPCLYVTQWYMADDDLDGRGRPTLRKWTISTIPGYIKADPDEIAISCTQPELDEIRAAVADGFYYA